MRKRQAGRIGEKGRCLGKVSEWEMRRQDPACCVAETLVPLVR